ncbi:MAG: MBL fold metallo-hydrolase [Candidatus Paceibacterota bacterium]
MKEWFYDQKKKLSNIFSDYGKIILVVILFFISIVCIVEIFTLIIPQKLRVSFLDIGQGDAIFIQTPSGKSMLIDGGPNNLIREKLASEISFFNHDIDVMLVTHPDSDHVTGLIPVLEKYNVKKIVVSPAEGHTKVFDDLSVHIENENADVYVAHKGDVIDFHDGVVVKILWPKINYLPKKNDTNDASVSVEIIYGNETFLLTGDLPSTREGELVANGLDKNITVYKASHHGSKYSSGEQLLTYIRPEYAVISAGKNNRYGHPNVETIDRLHRYAQEIISTIDRGTISFVTDGRIVSIKTDR